MASLFENNNKKLSAPRFTYTRKRPVHKEIPGVAELCRLCLEKCEKDTSTPIFTDSSNNVPANLALRIMICVGLEITQDEYLPNQVCPECLTELERCYKFRKKCEASFSKLKSHVLAVQMRDYNKSLEEKEIVKEIDKEPNAFVYMVNMDGTIRLCGEVPALSQEKLLIDVPKDDCSDRPLHIDEPVISENDVNVANKTSENDLISVDTVNTSKNNEIVNTRQDSSTILSEDNRTEIIVDSKNNSSLLKGFLDVPGINNEPKSASTEEDLSKFLVEVLTETLTIGRHGECLVVEGRMPGVEISTGDGEVVLMELVEEEEAAATREMNTATTVKTTVKDTPTVDGIKSKVKSNRECGECGRVFSCGSAMRRHALAKHRRLKPYACPHCKRTFAQKEVCRRHQLTHKETRPHECDKCDKSFTQRLGLEAHLRSHEAPQKRPMMLHPCPHCDKVFLHASGVSRHVAGHMGRQYHCGGCPRLFSDGSALRRHCKNTGHDPQHNKQATLEQRNDSHTSHPDAEKPKHSPAQKPNHQEAQTPTHPNGQKLVTQIHQVSNLNQPNDQK